MKRTLYIILALMMLSVSPAAWAQDTRKRTVETIVQDVLAQMPTQNLNDLNREMEDLAKAAPQSVVILANMLQPAEKHTNNLVEYAISGVVSYASSHDKYKNAVLTALTQCTPRAIDGAARVFLQGQLRLLAGEQDVTYETHPAGNVYAQAYDRLVSLGDQAGTEVLKNIKTPDHALRMQALKFATEHQLVDDLLAKKVAGKYGSLSTEGKIDVLNWLGDNKVASQKPFLLKQLKKGGAPAAAAIEALGKIGGDDAAAALIGQLGTDQADKALNALVAYKGNLSDQVAAALQNATGTKQANLLTLAKTRRIKSVAPQVFTLIANGNASAKSALEGVVTTDNAAQVAALLDGADKADVATYQRALQACVKAQDAKAQYQTINAAMKQAKQKDRFYSVLAATGTDESVADLAAINNPAAISALMQSKNYKAATPLLAAAKTGNESALNRYVALVSANEADINNKYDRLAAALDIAKSTESKKQIIEKLGQTPTRNSFLLVGKYLDNKDLGYAAACAEKDIINKTDEEIEYEVVKANLNKAIDLYKAHGTADDGYAVDELKKVLSEQQPSPIFVLSDEEKKQGFEVLFDGTNLDKWQGNKVGYVPINGNIYVTANYGNESNLYTIKEYQDFIYRFEFCFDKPGVNNGVGIRTPMGVDAAYDAMCECQILDHDDPIYAGLREYQVHGSVYGVIPAKRIKHKPLGEWSTEEIRVKGNHITVIVNGETIVDGDVKEACQGHNVAPDGSDNNPYTVDHRNHPGMFNKKGYISFCGHGLGVKFRNIRVLDLTAQAKGKKKK